jgi:hypothetical protein
MATADFREQQDRMRTTTPGPSRTALTTSAGGGLAEAACGIAVIGLAIAGLAHAWPTILSGIAQIVFGIGLLSADTGVVAYYWRRWRGERTVSVQLGGGLGAEAVAGVAGIVLGILTLIGLVPYVLSAVCVIVLGVSVILGGAVRAQLLTRALHRLDWTDEEREITQEAHRAALGGRALIGLAAIILGIISVVLAASAPADSLVLALVGLLCLGAGSLLTGAALGSQVLVASQR